MMEGVGIERFRYGPEHKMPNHPTGRSPAPALQYDSSDGPDENRPQQFSRNSSFRVVNKCAGNLPTFAPQKYNPAPPHEHTCLARDADYDTVDKRLSTFGNFPKDVKVDPQDLAENGLYFTGIQDKVRCAYCRGQMYNWEEGDQAFSEHLKHFPLCHFIMAKDKRLKWEAEQKQGIRQTGAEAQSMPETRATERHLVTDCKPHSMPEIRRDRSQIDTCDQAVKIVLQMGYEEALVKKAVKYLQKTGVASKDIVSEKLIDVVFEMEDDPEKFDEDLQTESHQDNTVSFEQTSQKERVACPANTQLSAQNRDSAEVPQKPRGNARFASANIELPSLSQPVKSKNECPDVARSDQKTQQVSVVRGAQFAAANLLPNDTFKVEPELTKSHENQRSTTEVLAQSNGLPHSNCHDTGAKFCEGKVASPLKEISSDVTTGAVSEEVLKLKEEQNRLQQNVVCNVCHRSKINILFLPCRHLVACEACSEMDQCIRCNKQIIGTVKIFLV